MIRIVAMGIAVLLAWLALRWFVHFLKRRDADWAGVAFAVGFVLLALWLHDVTGFGRLFG